MPKLKNMKLSDIEIVWIIQPKMGSEYLIVSSSSSAKRNDFGNALAKALGVAKDEGGKAVVLDLNRGEYVPGDEIFCENAVVIAANQTEGCMVVVSERTVSRDEFQEAFVEAIEIATNEGKPVVILPQSLDIAIRAAGRE